MHHVNSLFIRTNHESATCGECLEEIAWEHVRCPTADLEHLLTLALTEVGRSPSVYEGFQSTRSKCNQLWCSSTSRCRYKISWQERRDCVDGPVIIWFNRIPLS